MTLLGISGYAGAGKDTLATILSGHGFTRVAFADPMRRGLLALDPLIIDDAGYPVRLSHVIAAVGWDRAKRVHPEVRRLLQHYGTDAGRDVHGADCWVDATFRTMDPAGSYVISDVRFRNEAQAILDHGGAVVRITRPGCGPANGHVSEHDLADWPFDAVVDNSGTLRQLAQHVEHLTGLAEANGARCMAMAR